MNENPFGLILSTHPLGTTDCLRPRLTVDLQDSESSFTVVYSLDSTALSLFKQLIYCCFDVNSSKREEV